MKVKMVRKLTNKETPDVLCESSFVYSLPVELVALVNDAEMESPEYGILFC